ncbi:hypothetical protein FOZ62_021050, partial [Perkinsus olseni]
MSSGGGDKRNKKNKEEVTIIPNRTGYEDFLKETSVGGKSRKMEDYNYDAIPMPESCKRLHGDDYIYCTRDCHDVDLSDVFDGYDDFYTDSSDRHHD